jgi:Mg-chelatase subunit ChlD
MDFDINPADYRSLWMRPVVPARRDPAVAVLLDRSGSMANHGLIDRAFEGLVLLVEVCHRLGVPVAAWSFARHCREELGWSTPLDESTRRRLGRIPRSVDGRTEMETALGTVGESLARRTADPQILFVLSDGCPDAPGAPRSRS